MTVTRSLPTQHPSGLPLIDERRLMMGRYARNADGTPRAGILPVSAAPVVTGRASMGYDVAAFNAVTARTAAGVEEIANDGAALVTTNAAPSANSRIDVIWVRAQFQIFGDASNDVVLGVAQGVAALAPQKPAIPAGAIELATATIPAAATTTLSSGVVITQTHPYTAPAGGAVPFRNLTELLAWTTAAPQQRARVLSTGAEYVWDGARWYATDGTIIPAGVIGGTIDDTGLIIPTAGASTLRVDGVFSARYRVYECEWAFNFSAASGTTLRLSKNGAALNAAGYASERVSGVGNSVTAAPQNTTSWPAAGVAAAFVQGTWKFVNPFHSGPKFLNVDANSAPTLGLAIDRGFLTNQDATQFDGFEFAIGGQTIANGGLSFLPRARGGVMGGLVIETVRPGVQFTPDAAAAFRRAEAQVRAEFGRNIDVNSTYRDWDLQLRMYNAWQAYVSGRGPYPGHSKALHPADPLAFHTKGTAVDSDDWVHARIVQILADNGFIRNRLDIPNEKHHFEWLRNRDKNYGKPAASGGSNSTERGFLMALNDEQQQQIYDVLVGTQQRNLGRALGIVLEPKQQEQMFGVLCGGQQTAFGKVLAGPIADEVHGRRVTVQGRPGLAGKSTTLAAMLAWNDEHVTATIDAAKAGGAGAVDVDALAAKLRAVLAPEIVKALGEKLVS